MKNVINSINSVSLCKMNKFETYCYLICIIIMTMSINSKILVLSGSISLCSIVYMNDNFIEYFLLSCGVVACGIIKSFFEVKVGV